MRLIIFIAILLSGAVLETWDLDHTRFQSYWNLALATLAEQGVFLLHGTVLRVGNQLTDPLSHKSIVVLGGCNGFEVTLMLVTAILIYPSCIKAKWIGVFVGFFAVQGLNVIRLVCLYYLNIWDEEMFRIAHLYVWQSLIMLDVLLVLLLWLRWQRYQCKKTL